MPRPRSLTHDQVASAALAVIDDEGLAGLTMRVVAKRLGVSTMALYRYVDDRQELEYLVVEHVLGAVTAAPPDPDLPWRDRIEIMATRVRDAVGAHPAVAPLTVAYRHMSTAVLRWSETVVGILTDAGIEGERRVIALRALLAFVLGAIQLEHLGPLPGEGTREIAALPATRFPLMAETARQAAGVGPEQEFRHGLALLLDGLAGAAGPRPR